MVTTAAAMATATHEASTWYLTSFPWIPAELVYRNCYGF